MRSIVAIAAGFLVHWPHEGLMKRGDFASDIAEDIEWLNHSRQLQFSQ